MLARRARKVPLILSGGLTPENVGEAIETVRPFAVDVACGVEAAPGVKDPTGSTAFAAAVRGAATSRTAPRRPPTTPPPPAQPVRAA